MIEINDVKVLRFSIEEVYKLKPETPMGEGVDWFGTQISRMYPNKHILFINRDLQTELVYVALTESYPVIECTIVEDVDGSMYEVERAVN